MLKFIITQQGQFYEGVKWDFGFMTWSRKELLTWIDGEKESSINPETGLKKGQLPEYSAILPDELFHMFYRRNWYDGEQIDAISTFNMCRDRHLFVAGNIPDFWDLDTAFTNRVMFYVYIEQRGVAHVFEQENNAFSKDKWNASENKKSFRKHKSYDKCPNYLFKIIFPDWDEAEKTEYLKIRNKKRVEAVQKKESIDKYKTIKHQRDLLIRLMFEQDSKLKNTEVSKLIGLTPSAVRMIKVGER